MFELIDSMLENNLKESIDRIIKYNDDGKNLLIIFEKMVDTFKNILIYNNVSDYFTFCVAAETIAGAAKEAGATLVGEVLKLDDTNESDKTDEKVAAWTASLKAAI